MQGLHPAPLSRFVTSVSRAKLILEEAARLLTLLWRVSLPTDGQSTLRCEQVGGDTGCSGSGEPLQACPSLRHVPPGPDSQQLGAKCGDYQRAGRHCARHQAGAPSVFLIHHHPAALTRPCPHSQDVFVEGDAVCIVHMRKPRLGE